jgi:hypothetical protein
MSDHSDDYTGKKGLVNQQIITAMDLSETGERLAQPIEYANSVAQFESERAFNMAR